MRRFLDMLVFGGERRTTAVVAPPGWRRLFHVVAGSSIPISGIFISEILMIWALVALTASGLALDLVRFRVSWLNELFLNWMAPLLKQDEESHITGATYMVIAALFVFVVFGKEVAIPAMLFLSLGDPAAAIVGRRMPGFRIRNKSPLGTAAFICVGSGAAAILVAANGIDHYWAIWVGAGVAGVVELASIPPDDNLAIPILGGSAMYLL